MEIPCSHPNRMISILAYGQFNQSAQFEPRYIDSKLFILEAL